jgi:serpin B
MNLRAMLGRIFGRADERERRSVQMRRVNRPEPVIEPPSVLPGLREDLPVVSRQSRGEPPTALREELPDPPSAAYALSNNKFAVALHAALGSDPGNVLTSPFGARVALAMLYAGAASRTAEEMRHCLAITGTDSTFHADGARALRRMESCNIPSTELKVANSVWVQIGTFLESDFLSLLGSSYPFSLRQVSFRHSSIARDAINQWSSEHTRGRIRELLPRGTPSVDTRLVLANALYFKSAWAGPFKIEDTSDQPFYLRGGAQTSVPLMSRRLQVRYERNDGHQAIVLPYQGGELGMLIMLPDRRDGIDELQAKLTPASIHQLLVTGSRRLMEIHLPRMKLSSDSMTLRPALQRMGLHTAFDPQQADFSGINGAQPGSLDALHLSDAFQQVFLEMNESGTEAAASTASLNNVMGIRSPDPELLTVFRVDHPFLLAICHLPTQMILLMGKVENPAGR